ncbi:MAG TPA: hypothetical protein VFD73_13835, partial [Gemmatimonadales bacterium]|nr:hypothetical protein [Gemmatimonadales bacterium]
MDRRTIWAILLMMVIAIAPAIFLKRPAPGGAAGRRDSEAAAVSRDSSGQPPAAPRALADSTLVPAQDSVRVAPPAGRTPPPGTASE